MGSTAGLRGPGTAAFSVSCGSPRPLTMAGWGLHGEGSDVSARVGSVLKRPLSEELIHYECRGGYFPKEKLAFKYEGILWH